MPTKNPTPTAAIILAAGKGTRMKSHLPKVMHEIGNLPMLGHVIHTAKALKCERIVVVIGEDMSDVAAYARDMGAQVAIQHDQLGTGDAVLSAKAQLSDFSGNLLVLYGDTPLIRVETLASLLKTITKEAKTAVSVLGFEAQTPGAYGRLVADEAGLLTRIVEAKDASDQELAISLCNAGVMALRGTAAWDILDAIGNDNAKKEFYLTDAVAIAWQQGLQARAVPASEEEVLGVNSKQELAEAEHLFQQQKRAHAMQQGACLQSPQTVYFSYDTSLAEDVVVEPNVIFGPGVAVGMGARIKGFSHLEGTVVGAQAAIGPFARLRPGTTIAEDVKIGNFVEIKKSQIEAGAKISHLSYIGDAYVGEQANIGAGTITCNYDGYNKYHTHVGTGAFIGSNTALVAPITIGDGAMVAAGSVITENIAPDALALARTRQEQKDSWATEFRKRQKKEG